MPASSPVFVGQSSTSDKKEQQTDQQTNPTQYIRQVNEEVYKQNFELALQNKILGILRSLYPISMSSLNVTEVSQKIIDEINKELSIQEAIVHIIDDDTKQMRLVAVSNSLAMDQVKKLINKSLTELQFPLDNKESILSQVINEKIKKETQRAYEVFSPAISEDIASTIQTILQIKTFLVYPLLFGGKVLGTLTFGFGKDSNDLSRLEKETIDQLLNLISIAIDRAKLYEDLQDANKRLTELDKLKDEFVSLASHELRTPMAAIKGSISTILEGYAGDISEQSREFLTAAYNENDRLIRLVNNLLNTSRIESGKLSFNIARMDVTKLITEVIRNLEVGAKEKKLYLTYETPGFLPHVLADEDKIKEVIINLVGNAIKFTSTGGISIHSRMEGDFVITSVSDTGTGIHKEHYELLFKKFSQLKIDYTKTIGGTGLGLYICKKIIEGLGGKISLESEVGKGTIFYFSLPIAK